MIPLAAFSRLYFASKVRADDRRSLQAIFDRRPALRAIADVAIITSGNDEVWQYWVECIGAEAVVRCCKTVLRTASRDTVRGDYAGVGRVTFAQVRKHLAYRRLLNASMLRKRAQRQAGAA